MNKKVKDKITKPSTSIEELAIPCSWMAFLDEESFRMFPGQQEWRKRLALTWLNWASEEESLEIQQFCAKYKIPRRTLVHYSNTYPDFESAFSEGKLMIASRKRIGSLKRHFDKDVAFRDMHLYEPEWHQVNKYHADLKTDNQGNQKTVVVIERFPEEISASRNTDKAE